MATLTTEWSELPSGPGVHVLQMLKFDERKRLSNEGFGSARVGHSMSLSASRDVTKIVIVETSQRLQRKIWNFNDKLSKTMTLQY